MKNDLKYAPSRRDFMQLTAAGALTAFNALRSDGRPAETGGSSRSNPAADSALTPDNPAIKEVYKALDLNGTWSVTALPLEVEGESGYRTFKDSSGERLAAQVPGEVHLDLMRAGRMPDPNISDNARTKCRWPEKNSWWYRTEFTVPPGFRQNLRQRLVFEGIDLYGQVFVNGKLAGTTKDTFSTYHLDVKHLLQDGANELVVRVTSGTELAAGLSPLPPPQGESAKPDPIYGLRTWDQRRFLRKPAYIYGWDWCDPLPNIGIWKGVRLEGRSKVVIDRVRLDTAIRGREVSLEGEVILENLHPWSEIPAVLELRLEPPQGNPIVQRVEIGTPVGLSAVPCRIVIPDAQLWWPNGMGEQPLYQLTARVLCGDEETDRQAQTIGLRTIELDRSPLPDGSRFCFKVNGQVVYCKGGDWAPADLIPARSRPRATRSSWQKPRTPTSPCSASTASVCTRATSSTMPAIAPAFWCGRTSFFRAPCIPIRILNLWRWCARKRNRWSGTCAIIPRSRFGPATMNAPWVWPPGGNSIRPTRRILAALRSTTKCCLTSATSMIPSVSTGQPVLSAASPLAAIPPGTPMAGRKMKNSARR